MISKRKKATTRVRCCEEIKFISLRKIALHIETYMTVLHLFNNRTSS